MRSRRFFDKIRGSGPSPVVELDSAACTLVDGFHRLRNRTTLVAQMVTDGRTNFTVERLSYVYPALHSKAKTTRVKQKKSKS